jgi:hypothetical protein
MTNRKTNNIVVHFLDGSVKRGTTLDFFPSKSTFHLTAPDGSIREVNLSELKAVFFVRKLEGPEEYRERKGFFDTDNKGKKVMVEFFDGEVIFGYTLTFSPKKLGFFMTPGDPRSNNEKIFVVHSATKRIKIKTGEVITPRHHA